MKCWSTVQRVSPAGVVSTLASVDGASSLAIDSQGALYVGSEGSYPLAKGSLAGAVSK